MGGAADGAADSVAADYGRDVADPLLAGVDAVNAAARTVNGFTRAVVGVVNDGVRVIGAVNGIGAVVTGGYYGHYVSGRGPTTPLVAINQAASLVNRTDAAVLALTSASVDATRNVEIASANALGLAAALWRSPLKRSPRVSAASDALAAGLGALTESVRATCNDPANAIRMLHAPTTRPGGGAAAYATPLGQASYATAGATAALCRRVALGSPARACADFAPTSYDDTVAVRDDVANVLDAEARVAADGGDAATCLALRAPRTAVVDGLTTRAALRADHARGPALRRHDPRRRPRRGGVARLSFTPTVTPFKVVERVARHAGTLACDGTDGNLVVGGVGATRVASEGTRRGAIIRREHCWNIKFDGIDVATRERIVRPMLTGPGERVRGLDLLRATAILVVALHHTASNAVPGVLVPIQQFGWMGVDLFFVLSGYLIGSQLLKQHALGERPSVTDFYVRRAFRILPAFLVVLCAYFLIPQFREQPEIAPLWRFLTFTMNLGFDRSQGAAFSHAWSLCVEEYFYLLFPLICVALMRWSSFRFTVSTAILVVAAGALIRLLIWMACVGPIIATRGADEALQVIYPEYIYYPTYTRLDGLLVGAVLSGIKIFRPAWWKWATERGSSTGLAGFVLLASAVWLFSDRASLSATVVGFPTLSIGLGLLLVSSVSANGMLARIWFPGVELVATLAYSFYLTHKATMHLDRVYLAGWLPIEGVPGFLLYYFTSFIVAWLLYICVERPFLMLRGRLVSIAASMAGTGRSIAVR